MTILSTIILLIVPAIRIGSDLAKIDRTKENWSAQVTASLLFGLAVYTLYYFAGLFENL